MKNLLICVIVLTITGCMLIQVDHDYKEKKIYMEYKSPNKTLVIRDSALVVTDLKHFFDNPMSSIPSDTKSKTSNFTLREKEVSDLINFIQENKFFNLENYYGAPEVERSYTTSILIKIPGKEKEVIYRSNPAYKSKPDAFNNIESYILGLRK